MYIYISHRWHWNFMFSSLCFCPDFPCLGRAGLFSLYLIVRFLLFIVLSWVFFLPLGNLAEFSAQKFKKKLKSGFFPSFLLDLLIICIFDSRDYFCQILWVEERNILKVTVNPQLLWKLGGRWAQHPWCLILSLSSCFGFTPYYWLRVEQGKLIPCIPIKLRIST